MSYFDLIYIPPTKQFASDKEIQTLAERQQQMAENLGKDWILHKNNSVQKKVDL
jgi:hypothetical protein